MRAGKDSTAATHPYGSQCVRLCVASPGWKRSLQATLGSSPPGEGPGELWAPACVDGKGKGCKKREMNLFSFNLRQAAWT